MEECKTIYLCLAHMSEDGMEQKYVKEAFDTNWVVPMGPNVNAFEEDLRKFVTSNVEECCISGLTLARGNLCRMESQSSTQGHKGCLPLCRYRSRTPCPSRLWRGLW